MDVNACYNEGTVLVRTASCSTTLISPATGFLLSKTLMTELLTEYERRLKERGPAALDFLNLRVPHRYTAVYALADGHLRNLYLYDKLGEVVPEFLQTVPFEDSFCQFVLRDGVFLTHDSGSDPRLNGHRYQGVMVTYHGVPLLDDYGQLFGTLCHFDVVSHGLSDSELQLLQLAGRTLPRYLPRTTGSFSGT